MINHNRVHIQLVVFHTIQGHFYFLIPFVWMDFVVLIIVVVLQLYSCKVLVINSWMGFALEGKKKKRKKTGYPRKRHIWTNTQKPTRFISRALPSRSAWALNPVAVVTFPLYTMAERLHNVFLPVQFVAHTTAEWAGSTPTYPPTPCPMLMKSLDWGGGVIRYMETSEPEVWPAAVID